MIEIEIGIRRRVYDVRPKDVGFKFGDIEGHGNALMLFLARTYMVFLAVWSRTLSC